MKHPKRKSRRIFLQAAEFRFYEELNDFLRPEQRYQTVPYRFDGQPGIKDPIEALGVPVVGTFHSEFNMPGAAVPASAYGTAVAAGLLFAVVLTAVALVQPVVQMLRRDPQETLTRGDM